MLSAQRGVGMGQLVDAVRSACSMGWVCRILNAFGAYCEIGVVEPLTYVARSPDFGCRVIRREARGAGWACMVLIIRGPQ